MNYDLNINNYDVDDLEKFFNLSHSYKEQDIASNEIIIRNKILGTVLDKSFQNQLLIFLDEAKRILIQRLNMNPLFQGDGSNFVIDKPQDSLMNYIQPMNTFPTETAPGILNKLRRRTRFMSLAMNTMFRDSNSVSATDCTFTLSYTLKNVVGIRLLSIELPESIYLISRATMSNSFFIWIPSTDISGNIIIPDGCYDAFSLQIILENVLNTTFKSTDFKVTIHPISKKTTISYKLDSKFTIIFYDCSSERKNSTLEQSLGWILGFRQAMYINATSYTSEGIFSSIPMEYLFFVLNDYTFSNSSNLIAMYSESYIDKNILAKVPYSNTNFQILFEGKEQLLSPKRQYFGPIDIKKLSIQLLNKYGNIIDINCMNFSFTLEVEMIYDI